MPASDTAQGAVNRYLIKPSQCDVVVVIFWSRMGTPVEIDGKNYLSGTHFEFEDALHGAKENNGIPLVLVYRREEDPMISFRDPKFEEKHQQWQLVEEFFSTFVNSDGSRRPYKNYNTPSDFAELMAKDLQTHLHYIKENPHLFQKNAEEDNEILKLWKGSPFPGL